LHRPPGLPPLDASTVFFLAKFVGAAPVGALIVSRRPNHPVGWLMLAIGLVAAAGGTLAESARQCYQSDTDLGALIFLSSDTLFKITLLLIGMLLLFFPTGRLPSPR